MFILVIASLTLILSITSMLKASPWSQKYILLLWQNQNKKVQKWKQGGEVTVGQHKITHVIKGGIVPSVIKREGCLLLLLMSQRHRGLGKEIIKSHLTQHFLFQFGVVVRMCSTCTVFSSGSILNFINSCVPCADKNGNSRNNTFQSLLQIWPTHLKRIETCSSCYFVVYGTATLARSLNVIQPIKVNICK